MDTLGINRTMDRFTGRPADVPGDAA
jgi:hypothetical protein